MGRFGPGLERKAHLTIEHAINNVWAGPGPDGPLFVTKQKCAYLLPNWAFICEKKKDVYFLCDNWG